MKLSIVVPVYHTASTLNRCVESIIAQETEGIEVILVDDGSPDNCPQLCDQWAQRDRRINVIHKQNGGLSDARNAGIERAQGEFITFVDSDDFLAPDTFRPLLSLLEEDASIDVLEYPVYWHYGAADQQRREYGETAYTDVKRYWIEAQAYAHTYACNKIFRRELFGQVRFPAGQVFEDVATLPLLLRQARKVVTTRKGLYHYCANDQGITALARGNELQMLLNHHLTVLTKVCDTAYYLHVLNIQLDVCRLLHVAPTLPDYQVDVWAKGLDWKQRLKAIALRTIGLRNLTNIYLHKR